MSNSEELKEYLVGTKDSFLLDTSNNGKTIMLSGAWGAGKTHFWVNEVEPKLSKLLKDKASIYVSLYGKTEIEDIRNEILMKAYSETADETVDKYQKKALSFLNIGGQILSSISVGQVSVDSEKVSDAASNFFNDSRMIKATKYISDGGIICLDDFERKSEKISLNDLFGFISQLSLDMNCKVVIILNSDVFTGKDTQTFKTVKEKTINKFFNFSPTIDELFESIFSSHDKYKKLEKHKEIIASSIKETKELNARLYTQVLDNCLEWINKECSPEYLRAISLCTINFIKNHFVFDKIQIQGGDKCHKIIERFMGFNELGRAIEGLKGRTNIGSDQVINIVRSQINKKTQHPDKSVKSDDYYARQNKLLEENEEIIQAYFHYYFKLNLFGGIEESIINKINSFVNDGILN